MKTLVGTPIHDSQDDQIKVWLENVSQLRMPADLLLIDSSPTEEYISKVNNYCKKFGIKNYKIEHFDYHQPNGIDQRMGLSREIIRKAVLAGKYEAWFNWECEFILPPDVLEKMIRVMKSGNYMAVSHVPSIKSVSPDPNQKFGCDLIRKEPLERYGFLIEYPDMPKSWYLLGLWLKKRLVRDGGRCVELDINNPAHLKRYKDRDSIKLNLGCGKKHLAGYVNIDIQEPYDLKHDLSKPLPFKDGSVDEIFSEGSVISLFSRAEWQNLKKEIARVLRPGGKLELVFWDFEYLLKAFLENKDGERWDSWLAIIFSGQHNEYEFSKNAFTYDKLVADFETEGLINFTRKETSQPGYVHLIGYKKFSNVSSFIPPVLATLIYHFLPNQDFAFMQFLPQ